MTVHSGYNSTNIEVSTPESCLWFSDARAGNTQAL